MLNAAGHPITFVLPHFLTLPRVTSRINVAKPGLGIVKLMSNIAKHNVWPFLSDRCISPGFKQPITNKPAVGAHPIILIGIIKRLIYFFLSLVEKNKEKLSIFFSNFTLGINLNLIYEDLAIRLTPVTAVSTGLYGCVWKA